MNLFAFHCLLCIVWCVCVLVSFFRWEKIQSFEKFLKHRMINKLRYYFGGFFECLFRYRLRFLLILVLMLLLMMLSFLTIRRLISKLSVRILCSFGLTNKCCTLNLLFKLAVKQNVRPMVKFCCNCLSTLALFSYRFFFVCVSRFHYVFCFSSSSFSSSSFSVGIDFVSLCCFTFFFWFCFVLNYS